jgi:hypothetical protein
VVNVDVTPPDIYTPTPAPDSNVVNVDVTPPTDVVNPFDYVPAIIPSVITPPTVTPKVLTPLPPTNWGTVDSLVDPGLNPGWITDVPEQYTAASPVQSQFYWGGHPYQAGETFDRDLYRQVPAPAQPWGLQQMYAPTDINAYLKALGIGPIAPKTGV